VLVLAGGGAGRIAARHDYGWADRALNQRTDTTAIYHWASITKTLTAIAIMQLRDRGRLSLDDRVTTWVPELRQIHDPSGGGIDRITIRMLLGHSAGFQNGTWPYGQGRPWEPFEPTRWEQLVAMMPYQQLLFVPDSRYGYSNPGYIYLARVIESVTGDAWQTYVQKNIFAPLGLTRSYFGVTPYHLAPFRSNNYTLVADSAGRESVVANGRDFDPGITIPNGGWNAPLGDLARYVAFLTGAARNDTVLSRGSLEEMWRARFSATEPVATDDAHPDSVGLSFFVLWRGGKRFVGHTGHQAGFRSFFYLDPRSGAAVVAVFNTTNSARNDASEAGFRAIRDAALEMLP
jgi:CubicO group peptidase (beta-lactamase class C family)